MYAHLKILSLSILLLCVTYSCNPSDHETHRSNGALTALQEFAAQRQYPNNKLPNEAYYEAWQYVQSEFRNNNLRSQDIVKPWKALGPWNTAGRMLSLAIHPNHPATIWAGSASGGLWRTDEFGVDTSWYQVSTGYPVNGVGAVAVSPAEDSVVYIGTGEVYNYDRSGDGAAYRSVRGTPGIGILKSTDWGQTWEVSLDWTRDQNRGVHHIEVDPRFPERVVAATTEGVYWSGDSGDTWQQVLDVVMCTDVAISPTDPDHLVAICGNFDTPGKGIYYSADGGETWEKSTGADPDFQGKGRLDFAKNKDGVIYASIGDGFSTQGPTGTWTLRSEDHGRSWVQVSDEDYSRWQGWFAHDLAVHPNDADTIMAIGIYVHKSEDGGRDIFRVTENPQVTSGRPPIEGPDGPSWYTHVDHHAVIYHPVHDDTVLVACDGGVFISKNGGEDWESRNGGLQTTQFYAGISIIAEDTSFAFGGLQDNNSVFYDGSFAWTRILAGDGAYTAINPNNNNLRYGSAQFLNIYRSTNGGNVWRRLEVKQGGESAAFIAPFDIHEVESNTLYAATNYVYRTDDTGDNWIRTNGGSPIDGDNPIYSLDIAPGDVDVVYAGTAPLDGQSGVWMTRDGGDSWSRVGETQLPNRYPVDIAVHPDDAGRALVVFSGYGTGHIYETTDYGNTWTDITANLPDLPTNAVVYAGEAADQIYVGNDIGVYYTTDGGISWNEMQRGLPEAVLVSDLKVSPIYKKLYVGTHGNGMYMTDLVERETTSNTDKSSKEFSVYPNPVMAGHSIIIQHEAIGEIEKVRWVSQSGQVIAMGSIRSLSEFNSETIVPQTGSQNVVLQLINTKGEVVSQSINIVQQ